jgi:hypothetical protein
VEAMLQMAREALGIQGLLTVLGEVVVMFVA